MTVAQFVPFITSEYGAEIAREFLAKLPSPDTEVSYEEFQKKLNKILGPRKTALPSLGRKGKDHCCKGGTLIFRET